MEIEQKERKRIEALIGQKWEEVNYQLHNSGGVNPTAFRLGFLSANTHLQKEVIQPKDKRISELEAEIKALREAKPTVNEREWALKYRLLILDAKTLAVKTNQLELAAMIRSIEVHVNEILLPTPNQK